MKLYLTGGHVYDGESLAETDLLVEGGRIAALGRGLDPGGAEVVDATGCLVAPGFTDLHVHLRQPGYEAKETIVTGTAAAAAGGFTTVCAMPNLLPVPDDLHNLEPQRAAIEAHARVRVLPYGALTVGQNGVCLSDIPVLAPFVAGFSDDGRGVQDPARMAEAMGRVAEAGSFVAAHCELEELIPPGATTIQEDCRFAQDHGLVGVSDRSEWAEVERDIRLAQQTGCRLHICHASTETSFALVRAAKQKGLPVSCEVTPHHLLLSCEDIAADDGKYKMNPPLRGPAGVRAALAALLDGTVDAIATDHAPHTAAEKAGGFQAALNGVVGLETAFPALYTHLVKQDVLPLVRLLELFTQGPRRVLGLPAQRIAPGQPADFTLLDLATQRTVDPARFCSKGRSTPFAGWQLTGWPVLTVLGNRVVHRVSR